MKIDISFTNLIRVIEKMEDSKTVDPTVIGVLDELIESCEEAQRYWVEREELPIEDSFILYHASRNSRLVLEKMKERFLSAEERHENPEVIGDSLLVLPHLSELCSIVSFLTKRELTPESRLLISQRLRLLRNAASNVSMLPSPEEEKQGLDRKKLKRRFDRFTSTLQAIFLETEGPS